MPEKKAGVFNIIMGVFKSKKDICDDIVAEAENVIANYIYCRRSQLTAKYKKKSRIMRILTIAALAGLVYAVCRF